MKMKVNWRRAGRVRKGPMIFAIGDANPRPPIGSSIHGGTEGSNPASSSSQSVSAVNPESIGEKPRTLAAVCGWLGT